MAFLIGDTVRCRVMITVTGPGTPIDPTDLTLSVLPVGGIVTTYTYSLGEITRDSTGIYHRDITPPTIGRYLLRWASTGAVVTAAEGSFTVIKSKVLP